jgi:Spo0E like sporulation regulatory protein
MIARFTDIRGAEVVIIFEGEWTMSRSNALVLTTEIDAIRTTMYEVSKKVSSLTDPLLVQLSQILDEKLNKLDQIKDCA